MNEPAHTTSDRGFVHLEPIRGTDPGPFPGSDHIGLEVAPSGPYFLLEPPWDVETIYATPAEFLLGATVLAKHSTVTALRFTAQVRRAAGRWPRLLHSGQVYLRGFDRDGRMLWSGRVERISPVGMSWFGGSSFTVDLLPPMHFVQSLPTVETMEGRMESLSKRGLTTLDDRA